MARVTGVSKIDRELKNKQKIRKEMLSLRSTLSEEFRKNAARIIVRELIGCEKVIDAKTIFAYVPFRDEVDISAFIEFCWQEKKSLYVPKVDKESGSMAFFKINAWSDLESGHYGILEPKQGCEPHIGESIDVIIMPGVAFDPQMDRLGYGAGYYDRYLSQVSDLPYLLAPAFSIQILPEVPKESWDLPVNAILTEDGWM